jgi:hypothetical protein
MIRSIGADDGPDVQVTVEAPFKADYDASTGR